MMTQALFTQLYQQHESLVRRTCARFGFKDEQQEEIAQDLWASLWAARESWPHPQNVEAYLTTCTKHACFAARRKDARKGGGAKAHVPFIEDPSSRAPLSPGNTLGTSPQTEEILERTSLGTLIEKLANKLRPADEKVLLARLEDQDASISRSLAPSSLKQEKKRRFTKAVRAARRILGLPAETKPRDKVDPEAHLKKKTKEWAHATAGAATSK